MKVDKRNRQELKSYFVKNSIPTESNFADLINGMLNQGEDGIVKLPGDPLSIEAAGDETSQKKAISLYNAFTDSNAAWTLTLNPRSNPGDAGTARPGFSISDGAGTSRLFIDSSTGHVGVGTLTPSERLTVRDGDVRLEGGRYRRLAIVSDDYWAGIELVAREQKEAGNPHIDFTHGDLNKPNFGIRLHAPNNDAFAIRGGKVGIETDKPAEALHVNGRVRAGSLALGNWPANGAYVFFGAADLNQGDDGNYALLQSRTGDSAGTTFLNSPQNIRLRIGNSDKMIVAKNGNVGVGTTDPKGKLDVHGDIRFGSSGDRRVFGDSRANRNTVVIDGHWNELEVKGRVIDWTGSNLHIGYDNDHSSHAVYFGNGKLGKVELQGSTDLVVGGNIKTKQGYAAVANRAGVKMRYGSVSLGKLAKGTHKNTVTHGETFSSTGSYVVMARVCESHSTLGGALYKTYECRPVNNKQFIVRWNHNWGSALNSVVYYFVIGH